MLKALYNLLTIDKITSNCSQISLILFESTEIDLFSSFVGSG